MRSGTPRVFLLSPASLQGVRGSRILRGEADAPFMGALRRGDAVPLGDVYAFISSLYYRGKRAYSRRFGRGPRAALAITPCRGLVPDPEPVTLEDLRAFVTSDVDPTNPTYREPLVASAKRLADGLPATARVVLLGSLATGKYLDPLLPVLGDRLWVPEAFVGLGDMSRGSLMLRAADSGEELTYVRPPE